MAFPVDLASSIFDHPLLFPVSHDQMWQFLLYSIFSNECETSHYLERKKKKMIVSGPSACAFSQSGQGVSAEIPRALDIMNW